MLLSYSGCGSVDQLENRTFAEDVEVEREVMVGIDKLSAITFEMMKITIDGIQFHLVELCQMRMKICFPVGVNGEPDECDKRNYQQEGCEDESSG